MLPYRDKAEYSLSFDYKINAGKYSTYDERLVVLLCDGATEIGNTRPTGQELLKGQGKTDWTNFFVVLPSGATDGVQGKTYKLVFWYETDYYADCNQGAEYEYHELQTGKRMSFRISTDEIREVLNGKWDNQSSAKEWENLGNALEELANAYDDDSTYVEEDVVDSVVVDGYYY